MRALLDHAIDIRVVEFGDQCRAESVLDAVCRPELRRVLLRGVGWVGDRCGGCVGRGAGVVRGEGDVVYWVPVLGGNLESEGEGEERVDCGDYGAAVGDGEGPVLRIWRLVLPRNRLGGMELTQMHVLRI